MSISYLLTESSCWCRSKTQFGPKRKLISSFQLSEPAHQNLLRQDSISSLRNHFLMTQLMLDIRFKSPHSRSNHPSYTHFYHLPAQGNLQSDVWRLGHCLFGQGMLRYELAWILFEYNWMKTRVKRKKKKYGRTAAFFRGEEQWFTAAREILT